MNIVMKIGKQVMNIVMKTNEKGRQAMNIVMKLEGR